MDIDLVLYLSGPSISIGRRHLISPDEFELYKKSLQHYLETGELVEDLVDGIWVTMRPKD